MENVINDDRLGEPAERPDVLTRRDSARPEHLV
jgi:hypothetical protein